jgi:cyanobactin maturation PatA/PatG family protease
MRDIVRGFPPPLDLGPLWAETRGDPRIRIAVLDGPIDRSHPCFAGAALASIETLAGADGREGPASRHGTHVASIIFGQPGSGTEGIAPGCGGIILPIFGNGPENSVVMCSQLDLARAILQAVEHGAHVINISGGQLSTTGATEPLLENAIRTCAERNVLVVAAAGNDGCDCLHVPAALNTVLSVGAMDAGGVPLDSSNWGHAYQTQGLLAPGVNIPGAAPGGKIGVRTGTSFAAPLVSGVAALLLSIQIKRDGEADPHAVRQALLDSALPCNLAGPMDRRRCLAGRLNPEGALNLINRGGLKMSEPITIAPSEAIISEAIANEPASEMAIAEPVPADRTTSAKATGLRAPATANAVYPSEAPAPARSAAAGNDTPGLIAPSDCGCGGGAQCTCGATKQLVYALGKIGYDFGTEARRDSFAQAMPTPANPYDPAQMAAYIAENPYEAESLIWTLNLDATPVYAIVPAGPFAAATYDRLRQAFEGQLSRGVELVSIPGTIAGSVTLLSGQAVPVIVPAVRGLFSWATQALIESVIGPAPQAGIDREAFDRRASGIGNFLNRVYYDLRNLGITAEDRALNYAATNAFQVAQVMESAAHGYLELDTVAVRKSPVCRPDSDCYDIEIRFFDPRDTRVADKVYRFTVDVSDVMPVTIGEVRAWSKRA